ncbi:MAG TPA: serine hydrolase domain-containing protein [Chloroflexota bacterium]|nr:serine hydrolase domain-containing protein [Chloroflexota bacterium]
MPDPISRRRFLGMAAGLSMALTDTGLTAASVSRQRWTATGAATPTSAPFDHAMQRFMQQHAVRAGSLSVLKDGRTVVHRAYTWAAADYAVTRPASLFRIASCSKAFTCAAITRLLAGGRLSRHDAVFPLLGITSPAFSQQSPDPRINAITVQDLVNHAGGWNDHGQVTALDGTVIPSSGFDPVFRIREIAHALGLAVPPTKRQLAEYMYGEPLQFAPGTQDYTSTHGASYSNFGYVLLGLVVEHVTGRSYPGYVRDAILVPLGIHDVYLAHTARERRLPGEVTYDDPGHGLSALRPASSRAVPAAYGGGDFLTETMDAGGGLAMTSFALARFIHTYAVWGLGRRSTAAGTWQWARAGSMPGTTSLAVSRSNGIDYAYVFNSRTFPPDALNRLDATLDRLTNALR